MLFDSALSTLLLEKDYLKGLLTATHSKKTLLDSRTILIAVSSGFDCLTGEEMQKSFVGFTDYGHPVRSLFSNISVLVDWAYWPNKFWGTVKSKVLTHLV